MARARRVVSIDPLEPRLCLAAGTFAGGYAIGAYSTNNVVTDRSGNVYVSGLFRGTADFNPSSSKTYALTAASPGDLDAFVAKYSPTGGLFWVRRFVDTNYSEAPAMALDPRSGDVLVGGRFAGTIDFGRDATRKPNPDSPLTLTSRGVGYNGYFARLSATSGETKAVVPIVGGGNAGAVVTGVAADASGNAYLTGTFGNVSRDDDPPRLTSSAFVMKFNSANRWAWERAFMDDSDRADLWFSRVIADRSGNVYVTGRNEGTTDYDPSSAGTATVSGAAALVLKLTKDGNFGWVGGIAGDAEEVRANALALDPAGDLIVGGFFTTADFNFSPRKHYDLEAGGTADGFVAKYSGATGALYWAQQIGHEGTAQAAIDADPVGEEVFAVTTDAEGYVYAAGSTSGAHAWFRADQGGPDFSATGGATPRDGFVAKYNAKGRLLDAWEIGRLSGNAVVQTLTFDGPSGNLFATGFGNGQIDLDPSAEDFLVGPEFNAFVVRLA
jgi:hypothetical protein